MLQSIQKHIQGWVAGIIIAIISVTFALWGVQNYLGGHDKDKTVVKLDDDKITLKQFERYYRRVVSEQPKYAALQGVAKQILQQQILTEMIQQQALLSRLKKDGFAVSLDQVRQVIMHEKWFQQDGQFSKKRFEQLLYANGLNESQYVGQLQSQLMVDQLRSGLQNTAIVLPNEINQSFNLLNQKRSFGYFIVPAHLFIKQVKPTEKQLKHYYKQYQSQFMQPAQVSIDYLMLSPKKIAKTIPVSAQQVKNFYTENKAHYMTPRRWRVAVINQQTLNPKHLAIHTQTVQQVSEAVAKGQSFSHFAHKQLWVSATDKQYATLIKSLMSMTPGQVSGVVSVAGQPGIYKLVAVQDPEQQPLSAVKQQVAQTIKSQKAQAIFSDQADQLSNLTYTSPNSLAPAAKALGLKVQTTPVFSQQGGHGIAANKEVVATAFNPDTRHSGNNSTPISLNDGSMVVLRVNRFVDQHERPYAEVKKQLVQLVSAQLANKKAMALAETLKKDLIAGKKPVALAKQYKLIWNHKAKVVHSNTSVPQGIINAAFFMPYHPGKVADNLMIVPFKNNDIALLDLLAVHVPQKSKMTDKERARLDKTLGLFSGQLDFQLFNKTSVDDAKVKIDHKVLRSL